MVNPMGTPGPYDLVRARLLGLLDAAGEAELERALERDPELRRFAEQWTEVHALTRPARDEAPASRLDFESFREAIEREGERRDPPRSWIRRAAAAAALVVAAGAVAWLAKDSWTARREPLRLAAIDLAAQADPRELGAVPDALASYRPVENGEIRWVSSLDEGLAMAAAAERPVVLFGMLPTCPWCIRMQANGLRDEGVLALLEDYVPVRIDYSGLNEAELTEVFAKGYPRFEVYAPTGELALSFSGYHEAPGFVAELTEGLEILPWRERPSWDAVHGLAAELARGMAAFEERRFGEAQRIFAQVARENVQGTLPRAASERLALLGDAAAETLRKAFSEPVETARATLETALVEFGGTPYERDFATVLESVRADGRLPELAAVAAH